MFDNLRLPFTKSEVGRALTSDLKPKRALRPEGMSFLDFTKRELRCEVALDFALLDTKSDVG